MYSVVHAFHSLLRFQWLNFNTVCDDGHLRIVGGRNNGSVEGSVEICINNTYGGICDTFWDDLDALVVCRQLDFSTNGMLYS